MSRIRAIWRIGLLSKCPHCNAEVDLTAWPAFWRQHTEQDIRTGQELSVTCPNCLHNFEVVTE